MREEEHTEDALPVEFHRFFWESLAVELDLEEHAEYVIDRVHKLDLYGS